MSILSEVISGKITPAQGLSEAWQWLKSKVTGAEHSDPALASAIDGFVTAGEQALSTAASWSGTVLSSDLANFSDEVAGLVTKYAPALLGGASPLEKAGLTVLQALTEVGVAAINHEVASLQAATAPSPSGAPAAS